MRSIFFPFEQMVNFIDYLRAGNLFRALVLIVIISGLFFLIFSFWPALVFFTLFIIFIIIINIKRESHKNQSGSGGIFFGFILIFLAVIYNFTTKYYNEDLDITSYWSRWPLRSKEAIHIFSGEPYGNYYKTMDKVIRYDSSYFKQGKPESFGGYQNTNRVLLDPQGMGFVQEDLYKDGDKIKEQINYAAPLYTEKLHIVYNKKSSAFKALLESDKNKYLSLGFNDDSLIQAIKKCRIAGGKTGSSTKILSSIVLSEINKQKPSIDSSYIENASLTQALSGIRKGMFDIMFFMSGQPVEEIQKLLSSTDSFGLIGIEPSFVDAVNKSHDTKYRYADFSVKQDSAKFLTSELSYGSSYNSLPTLGSNCYLIANKKVKPYLIKKFINDLSEVKDPLKIDFLNFKDNYDSEYQNKRNKTLASLLIAFTGGVALGTVILSFIFALISSFWHDKIGNKLAAVIKKIPDDSIPEPDELEGKKNEDRNNYLKYSSEFSAEERENKLKMFDVYYEEIKRGFLMKAPYIKFYQIALIDKIVLGMSQLVGLTQNINAALENGKLNTDHFNDLLVRIDTIMDKLRKSLFLRLHELFNRENSFGGICKNDAQIKKLLLTYVTASYLNFDDYKKLIN